jgi:hypothetical protein
MYQILITRKTKKIDGGNISIESYDRLKIFDSEDYGLTLTEFDVNLNSELDLIKTIDYSVIHTTIELNDYDSKNHKHTLKKVITLQNF